MRLHCFDCGKSVSSEVDDETIVRACLTCPECIEKQPALERERDEWKQRAETAESRCIDYGNELKRLALLEGDTMRTRQGET